MTKHELETQLNAEVKVAFTIAKDFAERYPDKIGADPENQLNGLYRNVDPETDERLEIRYRSLGGVALVPYLIEVTYPTRDHDRQRHPVMKSVQTTPDSVSIQSDKSSAMRPVLIDGQPAKNVSFKDLQRARGYIDIVGNMIEGLLEEQDVA